MNPECLARLSRCAVANLGLTFCRQMYIYQFVNEVSSANLCACMLLASPSRLLFDRFNAQADDMKIGNFLFPESRDSSKDGIIIRETLAEAKLSDQIGVDAIWLAEHHFDGNCAYVDPVSFATALATATTRCDIGFAVIQTSLHHPVRLAEQLSLLDNISKGRLIVGLGRGTNYNNYEYQGYDIPAAEAHSRFEEVESIILQAWGEKDLLHKGTHWSLRAPRVRPTTYTKPHPMIIRSASGENSIVELGRAGRPFLMSVQTNETTRSRVEAYKSAMSEAGYGDEAIQKNLAMSWIWRNVFVAESEAEAERIGVSSFSAMIEHRAATRKRVNAEQGITPAASAIPAPAVREDPSKALIRGTPEQVSEMFCEIEKLGVGGVIASFRLGPMSHEDATSSLQLFMSKVAPNLASRPQQAA